MRVVCCYLRNIECRNGTAFIAFMAFMIFHGGHRWASWCKLPKLWSGRAAKKLEQRSQINTSYALPSKSELCETLDSPALLQQILWIPSLQVIRKAGNFDTLGMPSKAQEVVEDWVTGFGQQQRQPAQERIRSKDWKGHGKVSFEVHPEVADLDRPGLGCLPVGLAMLLDPWIGCRRSGTIFKTLRPTAS